ncbi:MAG TPA: S8 family serine peptidase [Phycisphaerae bacterium]|nr:S8 family serine peptidase [Phycisphaerae bacterium]
MAWSTIKRQARSWPTWLRATRSFLICGLILLVGTSRATAQPMHGARFEMESLEDGARVAIVGDRTANEVEPAAETFVPGRVILKFKPGASDAGKQRAVGRAVGARAAAEIPQLGVTILELPATASETAQMHALRLEPEVEFAELDRVYPPADLLPNDYWYFGQWHLPKIAAPIAWGATTGNSGVIIAICDTGIDSTHPDLASKLVPGWNVYSNDADLTDQTGHGTSVAGAAAAASNNNVGVASPAWGCPIMPIRVSNSTGMATSTMIATGILWAADHGAKVVNVSFYGVNGDATVTSAAQYLQGRGGVMTAAAGNDGLFYSAADNPYILAVGATGSDDVLASFSSRGNYIDLTAPGAGIYTTARGGGYGSATGTSFSAPIAAGVAALVMSVRPELSPDQVQAVLKQSANDLGTTGWDSSYGWGRVNAAQAVALAAIYGGDTTLPTVSFSTPASGAGVSGTITVQVSAADNVGVASVKLFIDGTYFATASAPYAISWNTALFPNGAHTLLATATDAAGNMAVAQRSVTVNNTVTDTVAPTVAITSPTDQWIIQRSQRNLQVYVSASDNVSVTRVELYVDGVLKSTSTVAPFTTAWNTRSMPSGAHFVQCRAYDAAGNVGLSAPITVYN